MSQNINKLYSFVQNVVGQGVQAPGGNGPAPNVTSQGDATPSPAAGANPSAAATQLLKKQE